MVQTPFRTTPSLGPDLHQSEVQYHWDMVTDTTNGTKGPSYQPGSKVIGNDGHEYVFVKAGAGFAAEAGLSIEESTWVASADASDPEFEAPVAVLINEWFHARKVAL